MQYEEITWYSDRLKKDMNIKVYGHYGISIIVFPSYNKPNTEFYDNGMIDSLSDYINDGKIKLFCLSSNDFETVACDYLDNETKVNNLDNYHEYVINEVLPFVYDKNGGFTKPLLVGCSMGGGHAAINYFRRPELFMGILSLSGFFDIPYYFQGFFNDKLYNNSPLEFLKNMDKNHPYIDIYNSNKMIFVTGQGSYEHIVLYCNYWLRDILNYKGINCMYEILDDSNIHDWPSWNIQMHHYLSFYL